jgi:hypothetical protein
MWIELQAVGRGRNLIGPFHRVRVPRAEFWAQTTSFRLIGE